MEAIYKMAAHLRNRRAELERLKESGIKIVGYLPGEYVPEEIIYASGAVPICLNSGGDPHLVSVAHSVVPQYLCPFSRQQIGTIIENQPNYDMIDLLVAPITCKHILKIADVWSLYTDREIFRLGVPHESFGDFEIEYYTERLRALVEKLEDLTCNRITDDKINEAIGTYNRMRGLLREISLMRKAPSSPISSLDFIKLNHASFYCDPVRLTDILDSLCQELHRKRGGVPDRSLPRVLLTGPNLAEGDYRILKVIEKAGGNIVIEEFCEGIRYYWADVEPHGDLIQSLANRYLRDRLHCAFMRLSAKKRLDFIAKLTKEFDIDAVIWCQPMYCETYDMESYFVSKRMEERNIPVLVLESDYGAPEEVLRNRVDAFIEMLGGK